MSKSDNKEEQIISLAERLFQQFGIRRVTMDEVAKSMAMSKKTLYKFFLGKEHLIRRMIDWKFQSIESRLSTYKDDPDLTFHERLEKIFRVIANHLRRIDVDMVRQVRETYPDLFDEIQQKKRAHLDNHFTDLVEMGQREGHIRSDLDPKVLTDMYFHIVNNMIHPDYLQHVSYSNVQIYEMIVKVFFTGILTDVNAIKTLFQTEESEYEQ